MPFTERRRKRLAEAPAPTQVKVKQLGSNSWGLGAFPPSCQVACAHQRSRFKRPWSRRKRLGRFERVSRLLCRGGSGCKQSISIRAPSSTA